MSIQTLVKHLFQYGTLAMAIYFCASTSFAETHIKHINSYYFGHSLVWHTPPIKPSPLEQTSIPYWMNLLCGTNNCDYKAAGQSGFLRDHAKLPPKNAWALQTVKNGWKEDFSHSGFSDIILTSENFIQYQSAKSPYHGAKISPLDATLALIDYVSTEAPDARIFIYENWPDMGGIAPEFPKQALNKSQIEHYHSYSMEDFHYWWLDYFEALSDARPKAKLIFLPTGSALSRLLTESPLTQIPIEALYEDNAPHGRPTLYFLAALTHYVEMFDRAPARPQTFPKSLHPLIETHYEATVKFILANRSGLKKSPPWYSRFF